MKHILVASVVMSMACGVYASETDDWHLKPGEDSAVWAQKVNARIWKELPRNPNSEYGKLLTAAYDQHLGRGAYSERFALARAKVEAACGIKLTQVIADPKLAHASHAKPDTATSKAASAVEPEKPFVPQTFVVLGAEEAIPAPAKKETLTVSQAAACMVSAASMPKQKQPYTRTPIAPLMAQPKPVESDFF